MTRLLLILLLVSPAFAHDSERIDQLEREIREIKAQLSELTGSQSEPSPPGQGWKSLANWRALAEGMSQSEVRELLGQPVRVDKVRYLFWRYPRRGEVVFADGRVLQWQEPR